jgi:hypothetical protein
MDYVTRQFINLTKRLLRDFRKTFASLSIELHRIKNAIQSIDKNARANQQKEQSKIEVVALLREPEGTEAKRKDEYNRTQRRDRVRLLVEWLTFLAVVFYGYMAVRQWREQISARHQTQKAVEAAGRSADDASQALADSEQHFRNEQRPYVWLVAGTGTKSELVTSTPLPTLQQQGLSLLVNIQANNGGHSPAIEASVTRTTIIFDTTENAKRKVARYIPEFTTGAANLVPNASVALRSPEPIPITNELIDDLAKDRKRIYVLGVIRYRDIFSPRAKAPYETSLCVLVNGGGLPIATPSDNSCLAQSGIK